MTGLGTHAEDVGDEVQVLDARHVFIQVRVIGDVGNHLFTFQGLGAHGPAVHQNLPAVKLQNSRHGFKCGGLAGAVVADKAIDFPRMNVQAQVIHRLFLPIGLCQMFDFQHSDFLRVLLLKLHDQAHLQRVQLLTQLPVQQLIGLLPGAVPGTHIGDAGLLNFFCQRQHLRLGFVI